MSYKSAPQEFHCPTKEADKSALIECPTRVSHKSTSPECSMTRVSCESVTQECVTKVSRKNGLQERPTRVSHEGVTQECFTRVSNKSTAYKSVLQECPTRVSNNVWPFVVECVFAFGFVHLVLSSGFPRAAVFTGNNELFGDCILRSSQEQLAAGYKSLI